MNAYTHIVVPPGFRFHPTDEELVDYYLRRKISCQRIDLDVIKDVDLYRIEPWDLQELCRIGTEEQREWYFFSHKDKKYPTGTRTNRATAAGFWKATGRDKSIYSNNKHELIGMRKTLVFYKGRAPNGHKSDWIMHEYRLETDENGTAQEEGWVVCRVFKKRITTVYNDDRVSFMHVMEESPKQHVHHNVQLLQYNNNLYNDPSPHNKKEQIDHHHNLHYYDNHIVTPSPDHFLQLPLLESPKKPSFCGMNMNPEMSNLPSLDHYQNYFNSMKNDNKEQCGDQLMDWKVFDSFVASQLGDDHDVPKESVTVSFRAGEESNLIFRDSNTDNKLQMVQENALASSSSSCQYDVWN